MNTYKVYYHDMWGNDKDGYDFNDVFSSKTVQAKSPKQAVQIAYTGKDRTLQDDGKPVDGWTFYISERQSGRRHVPKFYVEQIEE